MKCKRGCKCDPLRDFRFFQTWLSLLPSALNSELLMNRGSCIHPGFSLNRIEKCSTLPSLWINWKPSALIKCLLAQIQARCRNSTWPTSGSQREERGVVCRRTETQALHWHCRLLASPVSFGQDYQNSGAIVPLTIDWTAHLKPTWCVRMWDRMEWY